MSEEWTVGSVQHLMIYVYDAEGTPIGFRYRNSTYNAGVFKSYVYGKNVQGDVIYIFNTNGEKVADFAYDAWGKPVSTNYYNSGNNPGVTYSPFRYRGYWYDEETGLYYLNSRYYNRAWGRFLNADIYLNANGDILGFNMFAYCGNEPEMHSDKRGQNKKALGFDSITVIPGAIVFVDYDALPIVGHASLFYRVDGTWYLTQFYGDEKSLKQGISQSYFYYNKALAEYLSLDWSNAIRDFSRIGETTAYIDIEEIGDYSKVKERMMSKQNYDYVNLYGNYSYVKEYAERMMGPHVYNLFNNNCAHYVEYLLLKSSATQIKSREMIPKKMIEALK